MNTLDQLNHLSDGKYHRNADERLGTSRVSGSELVKASLNADIKSQLLTGEQDGRRVFAKSIETNFSINISYERPEFEFKVPSPSDVANTVLGFVERRIESEVKNGADDSRVSELLNQARKGVEAGFSSAIEDIESLGLMNEELEGEIGESRNLIDEGIDRIEQTYTEQDASVESSERSAVSESSNAPVPEAQNQDIPDKTLNFAESAYEFFKSDEQSRYDRGVSALSNVAEHKFASSEKSSFSLKTRDGDTVSIRFSESFASVYQSSNDEFGIALSGKQAFEFSVEGELDDAELKAINDLLAQVGEVSELFFSNRFQDAFVSALNVGFDSTEIASFSLDLSKSVVEGVKTYGEPSSAQGAQGTEVASRQRYMPLVDMANHISQINELMGVFDAPRESMSGLIRDTLERVNDMLSEVREGLGQERVELGGYSAPLTQVSVSQFMEYSEYVLLSDI